MDYKRLIGDRSRNAIIGVFLAVVFVLSFIISKQEHETLHAVEIGVIIVFILFQIIFSIGLLQEIGKLKSIFKNYPRTKRIRLKGNPRYYPDVSILWQQDLGVEMGSKKSKSEYEITLLEPPQNDTAQRMTHSINSYLHKNYGASTNFSIVKDMIDREVNNKDEEINNSISLPLYLGLAATMIGIIMGLFSIDLSDLAQSNEAMGGGSFITSISDLITGVKIAIFASLFGILSTSSLTVFAYKPAKSRVEENKNQFISYLQAELLPELQKADEQSITTLNRSLNNFSRKAVDLNNTIKESVVQLSENIQREETLMSRIKELDVQKLSRYNIQVAQTLQPTVEKIEEFTGKLDSLNNSLEHLEQISRHMASFVDRTQHMETIYQEINRNINDSKAIITFLNQHIEKIQNAGDAARQTAEEADTGLREAINDAHSHFREATDSLKNHIHELITDFKHKATADESSLKEVFAEVNENLKEATSSYVHEFEKAYEGSVPKFEKLNHLEDLVSINSEITEQLKRSSNGEIGEIKEELRHLNHNLNNYQSNNQSSNFIQDNQEGSFAKVQKVLQVTAYVAIIGAAVSWLIHLFQG